MPNGHGLTLINTVFPAVALAKFASFKLSTSPWATDAKRRRMMDVDNPMVIVFLNEVEEYATQIRKERKSNTGDSRTLKCEKVAVQGGMLGVLTMYS
jgi:hypothetical protein